MVAELRHQQETEQASGCKHLSGLRCVLSPLSCGTEHGMSTHTVRVGGGYTLGTGAELGKHLCLGPITAALPLGHGEEQSPELAAA